MRYITVESSSDDDEFTWTISGKESRQLLYYVVMNGKPVEVLIDSGSTVNIVDVEPLTKLGVNIQLRPYSKKVFAYNSAINCSRCHQLTNYGSHSAESHECRDTCDGLSIYSNIGTRLSNCTKPTPYRSRNDQ